MQVDLPRMGDGHLMVIIRTTVFLGQTEFALGAVRRKFDLRFDRKLQRLRRIEIGLLIDTAELDPVDDDRLVIVMQERALGVRQGTQAEVTRHRQHGDDQSLTKMRHRAFVPAVPESLSRRAAMSSASKEGPSLR